MQVTLDRNEDGGAVMLDRLYHFNPHMIPKQGDLAIVITPLGVIRAANVEDIDLNTRFAWMPMDGPGRERAGREKVAFVGTVTRSYKYTEAEGFPITAATARGLVEAASTGVQLRERIRTAILKAAEESRTKVEVPAYWVSTEDFDALQTEMNAVGFICVRSYDTIVINWAPRDNANAV